MRIAKPNRLRGLATSFLLGGTLAAGLAAPAQERLPRSLADTRQRPVDRLRLPRVGNEPVIRRGERGWEVHTDHAAIFAATREDAEWAARELLDTWTGVERLADHWTRRHRQPNFAYQAVQVALADPSQLPAGDSRRQAALAEGSDPVIQFAAGQVWIHLAKDPQDDPSAEHAAQLRHAVAHSFLHLSQLDRSLPDWVCEGLARYATRSGLADEDREAAMENLRMPLPARGRIVGDPTEPDDNPAPEMADLVTFLLEGDDGRHAGDFFEALADVVGEGDSGASKWYAVTGPGPSAESPSAEPLAQLAGSLAESYSEWRENPNHGQPRLVGVEDIDEELRELEQQLAFVLKLLERFGHTPDRPTRVKVQEFGRQAGSLDAVGLPAATGQANDAGNGAEGDAAQPVTFDPRRLYRKLLQGDSFWATRSSQGRLLLATDGEPLADALEILRDPRLAALRTKDAWQVDYRLRDGRTLRATWVAPDKPAEEPEVRFALSSAAERQRVREFEAR